MNKDLGGIIFTRDEYILLIKALASHRERLSARLTSQTHDSVRPRIGTALDLVDDIQQNIMTHINITSDEVQSLDRLW